MRFPSFCEIFNVALRALHREVAPRANWHGVG